MKFNDVVSLGYNCEVSYRIQDFYHKINAYPYNWVYCTDRELFLKSLVNLDDVLSGKITLLSSGMFRCEKYKISFHAQKAKEHLFSDGKPNEENVKNEIILLKDKVKHLNEKFKDCLRNPQYTLFVIKITHDQTGSDVKFLLALYAQLSKSYISKKFVLLAVFEKQYLTDELMAIESAQVKIRGVKQFAPDGDTLYGGDLAGWQAIFNETNKMKNPDGRRFFSWLGLNRI